MVEEWAAVAVAEAEWVLRAAAVDGTAVVDSVQGAFAFARVAARKSRTNVASNAPN